jgi:hypothetical protein
MDEPKAAPPQHRAESERERRIANIVLLVLVALVVGAGIWLVNALVEHRRIDECLARGGRNCMPLEVPAR